MSLTILETLTKMNEAPQADDDVGFCKCGKQGKAYWCSSADSTLSFPHWYCEIHQPQKKGTICLTHLGNRCQGKSLVLKGLVSDANKCSMPDCKSDKYLLPHSCVKGHMICLSHFIAACQTKKKDIQSCPLTPSFCDILVCPACQATNQPLNHDLMPVSSVFAANVSSLEAASGVGDPLVDHLINLAKTYICATRTFSPVCEKCPTVMIWDHAAACYYCPVKDCKTSICGQCGLLATSCKCRSALPHDKIANFSPDASWALALQWFGWSLPVFFCMTCLDAIQYDSIVSRSHFFKPDLLPSCRGKCDRKTNWIRFEMTCEKPKRRVRLVPGMTQYYYVQAGAEPSKIPHENRDRLRHMIHRHYLPHCFHNYPVHLYATDQGYLDAEKKNSLPVLCCYSIPEATKSSPIGSTCIKCLRFSLRDLLNTAFGGVGNESDEKKKHRDEESDKKMMEDVVDVVDEKNQDKCGSCSGRECPACLLRLINFPSHLAFNTTLGTTFHGPIYDEYCSDVAVNRRLEPLLLQLLQTTKDSLAHIYSEIARVLLTADLCLGLCRQQYQRRETVTFLGYRNWQLHDAITSNVSNNQWKNISAVLEKARLSLATKKM